MNYKIDEANAARLRNLAKDEKENIENYKKEINRLQAEKDKVSDNEEKESYLNSINLFKHVISEKQKLIDDIEKLI